MPYVNIPESGLESSFARLIGKLKGEFESKIDQALNNLLKEFENGCPSPEKLQAIKIRLDNIRILATDISERLNRIGEVVPPLRNGSQAILTTVPLLKALPIPGLALTAGVTTTFSDLLHLIKEFGTQLKTSATSIENLLSQTSSLDRLLEKANSISSRIDNALQLCELCTESNTECPADCISKIVNGTPGEAAKCIQDINNLLGTDINVEGISDRVNKEIDNQGEELYTTSNGVTYIIKIKEVKSDFTKAPLRQAVALTLDGGIVLEGGKSFSADVKILKREVKFRLDNLQV